MSKRIYQTIFSLLLIVALSLAFVPAAFADAPAPEKSAAKYETKFMLNMIDHHHMAVMMAEMCLEEAESAELLKLCEEMIAMQSQEVMMMHTWLQDWYGIDHEPGETKPVKMGDEEFEIEFMGMMVKHHLGAVKEGEKCLDRAYHSELLELCQNMIDTQTQEIQMMQTWLCDWYGICKDYLKM